MWNVLEYDELASTNTLASEMLARGEAKHGDVIVARHQTSGRGRVAGRIWSDEPGASLLMSVILTKFPEPVHLLQFRVALGVLHALRSLTQNIASSIRLKWPNDILIGERKVCGILLEAQWNGPAMRSAVAGIGVNVRQRAFDPELSSIATSLLASGADETVDAVRDRILATLEKELYAATLLDVPAELEKELSWMSGIPSLEVIEGNERLSGMHYVGVEPSGAIRLQDGAGKLVVVHNGSLFWNKQNG